MNELLSVFITFPFMAFCLGIAGITFVVRRIVEFSILDNPKLPGNKFSIIWTSLILPIMPVINGALAGYFAKGYPFPEGLAASDYGRLSFGIVAGLLSGMIYRVITEFLNRKGDDHGSF